MGKDVRRRYDEEFKREAVRLSYESGCTVAQVARDLGMNEQNLWRWRRKFSSAETAGHPSVDDGDEVKRLRRQLARVTEERDILKKALSVFSRRDE